MQHLLSRMPIQLCSTSQQGGYAPQYDPYAPAGLIGFSDRLHSPEILTAAAKNKKSAMGCMWVMVLLPLVDFYCGAAYRRISIW